MLVLSFVIFFRFTCAPEKFDILYMLLYVACSLLHSCKYARDDGELIKMN